MTIETEKLKKIIEGALMAASGPLNIVKIQALFTPAEYELELEKEEEDVPTKEEITAALEDIEAETQNRGFELKQVGNGWRFQVVQEIALWIARLWEEKPARYSRALMETLALIAYRQPITRGDIESIRGVAVSSNIIRTLTEREWVKVVGHRDVPGRPALYATTREFLDYFNIKSLDELPSLKDIQDLDQAGSELELLIANNAGGEEEEVHSDPAPSANKSPKHDDDNEDDEAADYPSNVVHLDPH